jgi:hypothetical protein
MNSDNKMYPNQIEENLAFYDLYLNDYLKRLAFCRENGCNTVMLTGNAEPQQNKRFLVDFGIMMRLMKSPFPIVEMQTTGVLIDGQYLRFLRNHVGVSTISLSLFSFNDFENQKARNSNLPLCISEFCENVKKYDFNLRLSLNLNANFDGDLELFDKAKMLGADQVTVRKLYDADDGSPQSAWIKNNRCSDAFYKGLKKRVITEGIKLRSLEYGTTAYSFNGMSVVIDDDCMAKDTRNEALKYLIVRPNGKLYSSWDDPASLIF